MKMIVTVVLLAVAGESLILRPMAYFRFKI